MSCSRRCPVRFSISALVNSYLIFPCNSNNRSRIFSMKHVQYSSFFCILLMLFHVSHKPILEYPSVSWNPYLIRDRKALESVQRRFTKRLPGIGKLTCHQRLSILELDSLELRRVHADLLFTYKLVFGLIDIDLLDSFVPRINEARQGHDCKLYLPTYKSNIRCNSFNYRVIQKWNSLPSSVDFTSLKRFYKSLAAKVLLPYCKAFFI